MIKNTLVFLCVIDTNKSINITWEMSSMNSIKQACFSIIYVLFELLLGGSVSVLAPTFIAINWRSIK